SAASAEDRDGPLVPLDSLDDWRIAEGEPDPRGWSVIAADGRLVGTIDELLVDTAAMKVRYFICRVDEPELGLDRRDRHIIVPAGHARLDTDVRTVILPALRTAEIRRLPLFTGERLRRELEEELATTLEPEDEGDRFYRRPRFDPARFYGPAPR
ncbi:MAG: PRC-barrel domain-containing protein, partial [Gemmatimonadota bacterium]